MLHPLVHLLFLRARRFAEDSERIDGTRNRFGWAADGVGDSLSYAAENVGRVDNVERVGSDKFRALLGCSLALDFNGVLRLEIEVRQEIEDAEDERVGTDSLNVVDRRSVNQNVHTLDSLGCEVDERDREEFVGRDDVVSVEIDLLHCVLSGS